MIHDIHPKIYHVGYRKCEPLADDTIILFDGERVCCRLDGSEATLPVFDEFPDVSNHDFNYLFAVDEERYFMPDFCSQNPIPLPCGYDWHDYSIFRTVGPRYLAFSVITAQQLYQWRKDRMFCGRCGADALFSDTERACVCARCGLIEYPKISPCVIVAVTHGEYLLLTRYKDRPYRRYALIAGFAEIGESLEDVVRREVFEETGIHVKNIKYYKSQPWGFTSILLAGFFCELDGDSKVVVDEVELSEAAWVLRGDIPPADSDISLTSEMMEMFRTG